MRTLPWSLKYNNNHHFSFSSYFGNNIPIYSKIKGKKKRVKPLHHHETNPFFLVGLIFQSKGEASYQSCRDYPASSCSRCWRCRAHPFECWRRRSNTIGCCQEWSNLASILGYIHFRNYKIIDIYIYWYLYKLSLFFSIIFVVFIYFNLYFSTDST